MLAGFIGLNFLIAALGGLATASSVSTWYLTLNQPDITPPSWVFGPVWTMLYLMIAVAAWWIWLKAGSLSNAGPALTWYVVQLMFNLSWSILFFGLQSPFYAFIDIVLLWIAIVLTMYHFFKWSNLAGFLILPYLLWVTFAAALNLQFVRLN